MEPVWVGISGLIILLVLIVAGVHISLALVLVGTVGVILIVGLDQAFALLVSTFFHRVFRAEFIIIPLFVLVGLVAALGGLSRDTYEALSLWFNRLRGGLGIATIAGCTAFGTVSGSSLVTATVFAKVSAPDMRRMGYDKRLTYGLVSAAGAIGMLIPPSVLIIIYSILTEESPGKLLIGGITPGILLFIVFSLGIWIIGYIKPSAVGWTGTAKKVTWRQRIISLRLLWPMVLVASILIMGIFFGVFSVHEAAAFAVAVVCLVVLVTRRSLKGIGQALGETAAITAMVFFIFIGATMFARFLMLSGLGPIVLNYIIGLDLSPLGIVIVMCVLYLILGCFLDSISTLAVTIPIIYPVILTMGIDPIWYGMSVILAIEVGLITPPVGLNVYAVKGVAEADVSLEDIFIGAFPFFFMMLVALAIVIAFPALSTTLPNLMIK